MIIYKLIFQEFEYVLPGKIEVPFVCYLLISVL